MTEIMRGFSFLYFDSSSGSGHGVPLSNPGSCLATFSIQPVMECSTNTCEVRVITCTHLFLPVLTCTYLYLPVFTCTHLFLPVLTCTYLYLPVCACIYLYLPVRTCTNLYLPVLTCTNYAPPILVILTIS